MTTLARALTPQRGGSGTMSMDSRQAADATTRHASQIPATSPIAKLAVYSTNLPPSTVNSFCGAMAGMASGIVTCPLDVIKTKLQAQGAFRPRQSPNIPSTSVVYKGMRNTAQTIWHQDGLRGMYRGLGPMLLGYLPTWAVYMSVYEGCRDSFYTRFGRS